MKHKEPIKIDFLEFFKTGEFDCIQLGQNQAFILSKLGKPDTQFTEEMKKDGWDIWMYGIIELHFFDGHLTTIFSDHFHNRKLNGGKKIKVKKWIFKKPRKMILRFVLAELNHQNIDYKKKTDNLGILLRLTSGIELTFENVDNKDGISPNDFHLSAFALIEENPFRWK